MVALIGVSNYLENNNFYTKQNESLTHRLSGYSIIGDLNTDELIFGVDKIENLNVDLIQKHEYLKNIYNLEEFCGIANLIVHYGVIISIIFIIMLKTFKFQTTDFLILTVGTVTVNYFTSTSFVVLIYFLCIYRIQKRQENMKLLDNPNEISNKNMKGDYRMQIGIDARGLNEKRAGIGTYIYEIIKKMNENNDSNEYYLYSNKKINIDFILNDNWHVHEQKAKIGTIWLRYILPKQLQKDGIDVFWGTQHCVPKRNKYTENIKYILTIHDLAIIKFKNIGEKYNTIIQKTFLKRSCKESNKIIAVSESTKKDLIDILSIEPDKIDVIYEGVCESKLIKVEEEIKKKIIEKYNLKKSGFILFLSTIEPRKNLDTIIKAFEVYKDENKNNLKFVIAGKYGWKYKNTIELIEKSKYKEDIILTGYITDEEKQFFYENCNVFIYTSIYEGFGLPILEAMQKGTLVITSNVSSMPEVGGNIPFYLNNVYSENELANLIKEVCNLSDEMKNKRIEQGKIQARKFTWEKCTKQMIEELKNIN